MKKVSRWIASLFVAVVVAGCSDDPKTAVQDPGAEKLLRWSMDQYKGLHSFSAVDLWSSMPGSGETFTVTRSIQYASPNKFKVVGIYPNHHTLTAVCNGIKLVSTLTGDQAQATIDEAPDSFSSYNGSLLCAFFAGGADLAALADVTKAPITFGKTVSDFGEPAREVNFYASGNFGRATAVIGQNTGRVYRLTYDNAGLLAQVAANSATKGPRSLNTVETFSQIEFDPKQAQSFVARPPAGVPLVDNRNEGEPNLAVALGARPPDLPLANLDGQSLKLSSLRGKPVLIDFWATWCGPCKEVLPHTEAIYKDLARKGLQVLAVSDEPSDKIASYIKSAGYTFPLFRDPDADFEKAIKISGLPTLVILDKNGNLASYFIGVHPEAEIRDALADVGIS